MFSTCDKFYPFYTLTVSLLHPFYRTNKERLTGDDVYRITNYVKAVRILCAGVGSGELLLMG